MKNPEVTLSEYWRIIQKRKGNIAFVFIMVMISTFFFTKLQTPLYQSSLEMRIEKSTSIDLDDSKSNQGQPLYFYSQEEDLATEIRLIKSLPVMHKVVEKMEILPTNQEDRAKRIHSLALQYQGNVQVSQIEGTNIVNIQVYSNKAENAALMVTAISDVYIVENIQNRKRQAMALMEYIEKQLVAYGGQISSEEDTMQKFNQNEKVFEVIPRVKEALDRMTIEGTFEFEEKLLAIDAELKNLNLTLKDQEPNEISKILASEKWQKNFIFVGLKRRLLEIEFECFLLLIDYTEKHPTVIAKTNEIEEVKRKLISTIKNIPNIRGSIQNNNYLDLANNHIFLNIRSEVLYRIINGFYGDSGSLSGNQLKYVRLKRNIDRLLIAYDKLLIQKQEVKLNLAKVIDDVVTVVSPAITPRHPIKPNARNNYMVSIVVGLLLGLLLCFISESMDSSIGTISDVEDELKLSILGIIPYMSKEEVLMGETLEVTTPKDKKLELQKRRLVTISNPKSWAAESIKMLRTNLVQLLKTNNKKTILFTSSDKQEGKSTLVTNMALSLAQLGMKTVLVGCNLRRPTLYKIFGLTRAPGVSDILMGNIDWRNTVRTSTDILTGGLNIDHLLQMPGIDNLNIIPCGIPVDNISEILNSTALDTLLAELKENYDAVIIDCSPVMAVPDAITLCNKVDGVVLVYKVGHTPKDILARCKSNLLNANANIFGIVLNAMRSQTQLGYSAYYYRYYADTPDEKNNLFSKLKKKLTGTQDAENLS